MFDAPAVLDATSMDGEGLRKMYVIVYVNHYVSMCTKCIIEQSLFDAAAVLMLPLYGARAVRNPVHNPVRNHARYHIDVVQAVCQVESESILQLSLLLPPWSVRWQHVSHQYVILYISHSVVLFITLLIQSASQSVCFTGFQSAVFRRKTWVDC